MPNDFPYDVFLSHSAKDKSVVRPLAERLRADGLKVWFDEWAIKPGNSIPAKIEEGLEHSRVLVLCMSAQAFGSDWAQLEAGTFRFRDPINRERRFIPLRLDDAPLKGSLAQFLFIDWRPAEREQEYPKLLEACRPPAKSTAATAPPDRSDLAASSIGNAWSGLRGLLQGYSTKTIKGILGKAGLPIARMEYRGTFKGPVLDEADNSISAMADAERDRFVVGCIQEIVAFERETAANLTKKGFEPDGQVLRSLRQVLARFGHDLARFELE